MANGGMITQLFALLGFKIDSGKLSVFQKQVGDTKQKLDDLGEQTNKSEKNIALFTITVGACITALVKLAQQVSDTAARLDNFNKRTNISTQALQQWEAVAKQSNVQAESITSAFESIVKARGDLLTGSGNVKAWAILGIDPSQDPNIVFNQLLQKLGEIDDVAIRTKRLSDLGLDPQLVNLVGKSLNDIVGINSKLLVMNEKEKTSLLSLKKVFVDFRLVVMSLISKLRLLFTPIIFIVDLFNRTVSMVYDLLDKLGLLNIAIGILSAGLLWLAVAILPVSGQFLLITGIILGFIAVIEDLYTFLKGGDSLIGRFFKSFLPEEWVEGIRTGINTLLSVIKFLSNVLINGVLMPFKLIFKFVKLVGSGIKLIAGGISGLFGAKKVEDEAKMDFVKKGADFLLTATKPVIGQSPVSQITNNPNITNTFNIDGAKDPKAVANEVASMQEQINTNSLLMESGY